MSFSTLKKKLSVRGAVAVLCLSAAASAGATKALADAYLDALKDAAEEVSVDSLSRKQEIPGEITVESTAAGASVLTLQGDMPAGLDLPGLESYLKDRFVGSYTFFTRLSAERKQVVFQAYKSHPEIAHIRDEIKKQYLQR
ncbi:MAG TPA: hypothetical protein ENJ35_09425 [Gammaproteobacteria bacterium]|nr:hypothetical protein [Gammaproteobacteria bacterium]